MCLPKELRQYIDLSKYTSSNTRLRIVESIKWSDGKFDNRVYKTSSFEQFKNCIVSNTVDCISIQIPMTISNISYHMIKDTIKINNKILPSLDKPIWDIINQDYKIINSETNDCMIIEFRKQYKCPYSDKIHTNCGAFLNLRNGSYYFKCIANSCWNLKQEMFLFKEEEINDWTYEQVEEEADDIIPNNLDITNDLFNLTNGLTETMNRQYIQLDDSLIKTGNNHYFVSSNCGTGKTEMMINNFHKFKWIVFLSTRKTFTKSVTNRLIKGGYDFVAYNDNEWLKGGYMKLSQKTPYLMIQIESIEKLKNWIHTYAYKGWW